MLTESSYDNSVCEPFFATLECELMGQIQICRNPTLNWAILSKEGDERALEGDP